MYVLNDLQSKKDDMNEYQQAMLMELREDALVGKLEPAHVKELVASMKKNKKN